MKESGLSAMLVIVGVGLRLVKGYALTVVLIIVGAGFLGGLL